MDMIKGADVSSLLEVERCGGVFRDGDKPLDALEYPMTVEGQTAYIRDLRCVIRAVPQNRGKGFFWWEAAWLPVPGSGWAKKPGWEYIGKQGPEGNEWANQTLFDFEGRALPTLEKIRDFH